ncbi:MAG: EscU/YscU/HrcU family type III secretion system export apparatus switch protein [Austwickia sp.]|nr:EscU/YscU/HrcU family type III secretion system export apparatus switch protein [Austwickia sp.]
MERAQPRPWLEEHVRAAGRLTFAKTLLKFVVFGFVAYQGHARRLEGITISGAWSIGAIISIGSQAALNLLRVVAMVGLAIAALDYGHGTSTDREVAKMTKEEIKKESKKSEGDLQLCAAIKARQREVGRRRLMASVSEASVVRSIRRTSRSP